MTMLIALLLSQVDVKIKGNELTARADQAPSGAVVRFRWWHEVYSISRGDFELTLVPTELGSELAQVRRGYADSVMTVSRPGVYRVDASCEVEDQIDPKWRSLPAVRWSKTVVVGSCKDWIESAKESHKKIVRWMEEADRIVSAGVTELTRDQVERIHDQIEKARPAILLSGSLDVLQGLTRDMVSGLCYPKLQQAVVVRKGQPRNPLKDDEPEKTGSAEGEFGVPEPDQKGPTDLERNARAAESFKAALAKLKEPLRREFELALVWRASLKLEADLSPLAEAEKGMAEADSEFRYELIRNAKDPEWPELIKSLLKPAR